EAANGSSEIRPVRPVRPIGPVVPVWPIVPAGMIQVTPSHPCELIGLRRGSIQLCGMLPDQFARFLDTLRNTLPRVERRSLGRNATQHSRCNCEGSGSPGEDPKPPLLHSRVKQL